MTADGIDHGTHVIADCFEAVIERYADGFVNCPIIWSGGTCQECFDIWRKRKHDRRHSGGRGYLLHDAKTS